MKQARRLPATEAVATAPPLDPHSATATPKVAAANAASSAKVAAATPATADAAAPADPQIPSFTVSGVAVQAKKTDPVKTVAPAAPAARPTDAQTARILPAKTAENTVSRPVDPTALPQPRFDSL